MRRLSSLTLENVSVALRAGEDLHHEFSKALRDEMPDETVRHHYAKLLSGLAMKRLALELDRATARALPPETIKPTP